MIAEFESEVPEEYRHDMDDEYLLWEGVLLAREGSYDEAIATLRQRETPGCTLCRHVPLAEVYDLAGERDSAIVHYADYVNAHEAYRLYWDQSSLGPSLERLGQLLGQPENEPPLFIGVTPSAWIAPPMSSRSMPKDEMSCILAALTTLPISQCPTITFRSIGAC